MTVQRDYVQREVWNQYKRYLYVLRHGLNISDMPNVSPMLATIEMPDRLNLDTIKAFEALQNKQVM